MTAFINLMENLGLKSTEKNLALNISMYVFTFQKTFTSYIHVVKAHTCIHEKLVAIIHITNDYSLLLIEQLNLRLIKSMRMH